MMTPRPWHLIFSIASRTFVWGLLFFILYTLRSFFLLIFLTFVFSYILTNGVAHLQPYIGNRLRRVALVSMLFLSVLLATLVYLTPRVIEQGQHFAQNFGQYAQNIDKEIIELSSQYDWLEQLTAQLKDPDSGEIKPSMFVIKHWLGWEDEESSITYLLDGLKNLSVQVLSVVSAFLLALLLSILIVLDLPNLSKAIVNLRNTRLRFIYDEVADSIYNFGRVLGQAFEAQFIIALINTTLTAIGLYALGLGPHIAFLSVLVFLFGFVPFIGVFISSVPICLIALQTSGIYLVLVVIVFVTIIHLIEGYVLNPRIYGYRMHINPVIVLIILTVGGKLFHFWGLILGVPVCTYIFGHAIRCREVSPPNIQPSTQPSTA